MLAWTRLRHFFDLSFASKLITERIRETLQFSSCCHHVAMPRNWGVKRDTELFIFRLSIFHNISMHFYKTFYIYTHILVTYIAYVIIVSYASYICIWYTMIWLWHKIYIYTLYTIHHTDMYIVLSCPTPGFHHWRIHPLCFIGGHCCQVETTAKLPEKDAPVFFTVAPWACGKTLLRFVKILRGLHISGFLWDTERQHHGKI